MSRSRHCIRFAFPDASSNSNSKFWIEPCLICATDAGERGRTARIDASCTHVHERKLNIRVRALCSPLQIILSREAARTRELANGIARYAQPWYTAIAIFVEEQSSRVRVILPRNHSTWFHARRCPSPPIHYFLPRPSALVEEAWFICGTNRSIHNDESNGRPKRNAILACPMAGSVFVTAGCLPWLLLLSSQSTRIRSCIRFFSATD